ncbi:MAG: type I-U CRISPR-associated protein Cas5/Cas6, partial [Deltaproteobacteria bacterium]|nr:type I-U CRISPR-associated protein Cas5/Cas6 [Deltaproteobacteria bacterium]
AHEGRYHGAGDELPSPFRLFQSLIAGAGISGPLDDHTKRELVWIEGLPAAPLVASPRLARGQAVTMFMPNNDLDKFGGDVRNIAKTRGAQKVWRPRHFDAAVPWIYAWPFAEGGETHANTVCTLAEKLYQLGRGVDMAWAWGEVLDEAALDARLVDYNGIVRRPNAGDGLLLACPEKGSFESLERRYQALRFRTEGGQRVFVQQPKPIYRRISYESPPARHVFELRSSADSERRVAWPLGGASSLVVATREAARARLVTAMPDRLHDVDRHLVGRKPDGSNAVPAESRVRIIAIPSIGMHYADRAIRRLLVEIPAACPLRSADVRWAFSGAELVDPDTGEAKDVLLSPSAEDDMLRHYGVGAGARVFRSVTPVVLPEEGKRRRIEPTRKLTEAKRGLERVLEVSGARAAVVQALRHAGVSAPAESIRLQREPFDGAGSRVEPFAEGTRFEKERLWHVEIAFGVPVEGPLLLGDGRFLGLGLMAPARDVVPGAHAFAITDGLTGQPEPLDVARALRRAVMARVQATLGARERLAAFFSGHAEDGAPVRRSRSSHLSFAFEPHLQRLLILAPHVVERRAPTPQELDHLRTLDTALEGFCELRAGDAEVWALLPMANADDDEDTLFGRSRVWESISPYVVMRHSRVGPAEDALVTDILAECRRLGLPPPMVEVRSVRNVVGIGTTGEARLIFTESIAGPLVIGRTRYAGGGLFVAAVALRASQTGSRLSTVDP